MHFGRDFKMQTRIARFYNIYGPNVSPLPSNFLLRLVFPCRVFVLRSFGCE